MCREVEPELDVGVELLRLDALADGLRTRGFAAGDALAAATSLGSYLGDVIGFDGDHDTYHDPANGLLSRVLDRKRGLPITLSIVYVSIARRLGVPAFGIGLPGHFVAGVGGGAHPVVVDPFHGGRVLETAELRQRVHDATGGRTDYTRSMLRPASPALVLRRLLNNLTRDFTNLGDVEDALWTVELKLLLPGAPPDDNRVRGELLLELGQFRGAADAFEAYVETAQDAPDRDEVTRRAIAARAKLN